MTTRDSVKAGMGRRIAALSITAILGGCSLMPATMDQTAFNKDQARQIITDTGRWAQLTGLWRPKSAPSGLRQQKGTPALDRSYTTQCNQQGSLDKYLAISSIWVTSYGERVMGPGDTLESNAYECQWLPGWGNDGQIAIESKSALVDPASEQVVSRSDTDDEAIAVFSYQGYSWQRPFFEQSPQLDGSVTAAYGKDQVKLTMSSPLRFYPTTDQRGAIWIQSLEDDPLTVSSGAVSGSLKVKRAGGPGVTLAFEGVTAEGSSGFRDGIIIISGVKGVKLEVTLAGGGVDSVRWLPVAPEKGKK